MLISNRLIASNLSLTLSKDKFRKIFYERIRPKSVFLLYDPKGHPKGKGMIEFRYAEDAKATMEMLNETVIEGRPM